MEGGRRGGRNGEWKHERKEGAMKGTKGAKDEGRKERGRKERALTEGAMEARKGGRE